LHTHLYTGNQNIQKILVNQWGMAERVGFEPTFPITRAEFLAKALKLANDKARELVWIV